MHISVYAEDDDKEKARSEEKLVFQVRTSDPRPWTYKVEQFDDGTFSPVTVGLRGGEHILAFQPAVTVRSRRLTDGGFEFIEDYLAGITADGFRKALLVTPVRSARIRST